MFDLVLLIGSLIVSSFISGWGLSVVWNWFIPDMFGITQIGIVQAIGLTIVLKLMSGFSTKESEETSIETVVYATFKQSFLIVFSVALAFVVRLFL